MQFKKSKAILAAVLTAAMASSAIMTCTASAQDGYRAGKRTKEEKYGTATYAQRFLSLYDDVITNGVENGYLSKNNIPSGGFGVPYHSIEEVICEAPDYGHETTSEAMSYIVWMAAMEDNITKNAGIAGVSPSSDLPKAWKTLEVMIPTSQSGFWTADLSSQVAKEYPGAAYGDTSDPGLQGYPSEGNQQNVGKNPIHKEFTSAYASQKGDYLLHWLADVDDWYGFGGSAQGELGTFTFINTFQRGDQESCFETIPHPAIENLEYGNSQQGMKFAFQASTAKSWSYTNAPDAEDRAIQAVYSANRWGVGNSDVTAKAAMMGDMCRNDMFDKYYKTIGCQSYEADASGGGLDGQHFLMSWYTAWGGAADGSWAWQIGCSHSHQFYQNPLAAYGLLYDSGLKSGMKSTNAVKDYTTSLQRQLELYQWLQSANGPFAGGCTNSWNGKYEKYPSGRSTFYKMAYVEHPVYADPGSNHWIGNQVWSTQRLAELYYLIKTEGDASNGSVKPGGQTMEAALATMLEKWVNFFLTETKLSGTNEFEIPATLDWSGQPAEWTGTYSASANSGLTCEVTARGSSDLGCVSSLANTLIYYAAGEGVEASGVVKEGSTTGEKALYLAQQLIDREWDQARDDVGLSLTEHNGSLTRFFEQEVYIPSGASGTFPYGYEVSSGATFSDLRPMYEDLPKYQELKAAWEKDKAAGAVYDNDTSDTSQFKNVAAVDLNYHRFWHIGDVLMANGAMYELYPNVTPSIGGEEDQTTTTTTTTTTSSTPEASETDWGNADCSTGATPQDRVDISDVILMARIAAEDTTASITAQGKLNANVSKPSVNKIDSEDVVMVIKFIARLIDYSALGK